MNTVFLVFHNGIIGHLIVTKECAYFIADFLEDWSPGPIEASEEHIIFRIDDITRVTQKAKDENRSLIDVHLANEKRIHHFDCEKNDEKDLVQVLRTKLTQ